MNPLRSANPTRGSTAAPSNRTRETPFRANPAVARSLPGENQSFERVCPFLVELEPLEQKIVAS